MNYDKLKLAVEYAVLNGDVTISGEGIKQLIEAMNEVTWREPAKCLPEAMGRYLGRKAIQCLVAVAPPKSRPNRLPRVTVAQRRWDGEKWVWSRGLNVIMWRELPDV